MSTVARSPDERVGCAVRAPTRSPITIEVVALVGLLVMALFIRYRWLHDLPRYTDEVNETMSAIDISRGRMLPLVSPTKHVGAYFNYLLAGVVLVVGKSPELPRTVVLITGLATVAVTYGYARRLGGPVAGLAAASLVAASAPHVLLSSRVAWSASLTPLLVCGAAWALDAAVSSRRTALVPVAGLLTGLAFQAHPSTLALLPGLVLFILLRGRWLLRRPALYVGGALFVLACANILIYSSQNGFRTIRSVNQEYPGQVFGPTTYVEHLPAAVRGIVLLLASAVDPVRDPSMTEPFVVFAVATCLVALVSLARRGSPLPLLAVLSALGCLPLLHDNFDPVLKARYTMPIAPLTYVAVGVLIADLLPRTLRHRWSIARVVGGTALWGVLVAGFLASLWYFETVTAARGCTNEPQRIVAAAMERSRLPGEWVLLDQGVVGPAERLGYLQLLEWSGQKVGDARLLRGGIWDELAERPSFLTVVNDGRAAMVFERQGLPIQRSSEANQGETRASGQVGPRDSGGVGLYRVTAQGAALLARQPVASCDQEA